MAEKLPVAFFAGLLSVLTPCVLPLVPGYLAAVSAVDVTALGSRGTVRRVVTSSLPFIAGLTAVFVPLGAAAAAIASVLPKSSQNEIAGFILVVIGLAFMGLLPLPKAVVAPGLIQSARRSGSSALLGGAFAVCAAPCIGTVLGSILVLASSSGTVVRGVILLVVYSLGLGAAFLIAGVDDRVVRLQTDQLSVAEQDLRGDRGEGAQATEALGLPADAGNAIIFVERTKLI